MKKRRILSLLMTLAMLAGMVTIPLAEAAPTPVKAGGEPVRLKVDPNVSPYVDTFLINPGSGPWNKHMSGWYHTNVTNASTTVLPANHYVKLIDGGIPGSAADSRVLEMYIPNTSRSLNIDLAEPILRNTGTYGMTFDYYVDSTSGDYYQLGFSNTFNGYTVVPGGSFTIGDQGINTGSGHLRIYGTRVNRGTTTSGSAPDAIATGMTPQTWHRVHAVIDTSEANLAEAVTWYITDTSVDFATAITGAGSKGPLTWGTAVNGTSADTISSISFISNGGTSGPFRLGNIQIFEHASTGPSTPTRLNVDYTGSAYDPQGASMIGTTAAPFTRHDSGWYVSNAVLGGTDGLKTVQCAPPTTSPQMLQLTAGGANRGFGIDLDRPIERNTGTYGIAFDYSTNLMNFGSGTERWFAVGLSDTVHSGTGTSGTLGTVGTTSANGHLRLYRDMVTSGTSSTTPFYSGHTENTWYRVYGYIDTDDDTIRWYINPVGSAVSVETFIADAAGGSPALSHQVPLTWGGGEAINSVSFTSTGAGAVMNLTSLEIFEYDIRLDCGCDCQACLNVYTCAAGGVKNANCTSPTCPCKCCNADDDELIEEARAAIAAEFPKTISQLTLNSEKGAKAYVENLLGTLTAGTDTDVTVTTVSMTKAVTGTAGTPAGTNGQYSFNVEISKTPVRPPNNGPVTLSSLQLNITAIPVKSELKIYDLQTDASYASAITGSTSPSGHPFFAVTGGSGKSTSAGPPRSITVLPGNNTDGLNLHVANFVSAYTLKPNHTYRFDVTGTSTASPVGIRKTAPSSSRMVDVAAAGGAFTLSLTLSYDAIMADNAAAANQRYGLVSNSGTLVVNGYTITEISPDDPVCPDCGEHPCECQIVAEWKFTPENYPSVPTGAANAAGGSAGVKEIPASGGDLKSAAKIVRNHDSRYPDGSNASGAFDNANTLKHMNIFNGWMQSAGWSTAQNYIYLDFSTLGYSDLVLEYDIQAGGTSTPGEVRMQYSFDNINWQSAPDEYVVIRGTGATVSHRVALPAETYDKAKVYIRWIGSSSSTSGTVNFRDIIVKVDGAVVPGLAGEKIFTHIMLTPGANASSLGFSWFTPKNHSPKTARVEYATKAAYDISGLSAMQAANGANAAGSSLYDTNKVTVTGLAASTDYVYRVGDGTNWSNVYPFKTANPASYSFIAVADPQVTSSRFNWKNTLDKALARVPNAAFVLSAGDHTGDGNNSNEVYSFASPPALRSIPFLSAVGNHDIQMDANLEQVEYLPMLFNWPNYTDINGTALGGHNWYASYGNVLYISLDSNIKATASHDAFMAQAIASHPNPDWIIANFHHDIYGGSRHAGSYYGDAAEMQAEWSPFLDKYNIDLAFNGHDHLYTRSKFIKNNSVVLDIMSAVFDQFDQGNYMSNPAAVILPKGIEKGIQYLTLATPGDKFYEKEDQEWIAYAPAQSDVPEYTVVEVNGDQLVITTYEAAGDTIVDKLTLRKTATQADLDGMLVGAKLIPSTDISPSSWAAFQNAINAADIATATGTAADIHDAFVAVYQAYFNLETSADKQPLKDLIEAVTQKLAVSTEGKWAGQYPEHSKSTLQTVLDAAILVYETRLSTVAQVTTALNNLDTAYNTFLGSVSSTPVPWVTKHTIAASGDSTVDLTGWMDDVNPPLVLGDNVERYDSNLTKAFYAKDISFADSHRGTHLFGPANKEGGRGAVVGGHITSTYVGEWIRYELDVEEAGSYTVALGAINPYARSQKILLRDTRQNILATFTVAADHAKGAAWAASPLVSADKEVYLPQGKVVVELFFVNNGQNVSSNTKAQYDNSVGADVDILRFTRNPGGTAQPPEELDPSKYHLLTTPPLMAASSTHSQRGWGTPARKDQGHGVYGEVPADIFKTATHLVLELATNNMPSGNNMQIVIQTDGTGGSGWNQTELRTAALTPFWDNTGKRLVIPLDQLQGYNALRTMKTEGWLIVSYYSTGWNELNVMRAYLEYDLSLLSSDDGGGGDSGGGTIQGTLNGLPVTFIQNSDGSVTLDLTEEQAAKFPMKNSVYVIEIEKQNHVNVNLPLSALENASVLQIKTDSGTVVFTKKMLGTYKELYGDTLEVSVKKGSFIVELLHNKKPIQWNDPENPLLVSIPFSVPSGFKANAYVAVKREGPRDVTLPYTFHRGGRVFFQTASTGTFDVIYKKKTFSDSETHWAVSHIDFVTARSLYAGYGNGTFMPDEAMTRAMFASVLANLERVDLSAYKTSRFTDVDTAKWYAPAVEWAAASRIVNGYGGELFGPEDPITREQMVIMLMNYTKFKGYGLPEKTVSAFNDEADITAGAAADAVKMMQKAGIVGGKPGNVYDPKGNATRAEVASVFAKYITVYVDHAMQTGAPPQPAAATLQKPILEAYIDKTAQKAISRTLTGDLSK
ncbi:MAG: S-layer homology domain-containing protein [Oscillospiraceae bacterium]|nr:S-layer homology domain-containing protein [Oscillospiraceae bacterium]